MAIKIRLPWRKKKHIPEKAAQPRSKEHAKLQNARYAGGFIPGDTYTSIRDLQEGRRGQCSVKRSNTTGNLIVVKHAHGRVTTSPNMERKGRRRPVPNEARMLLLKLQPHANIIRLYETEQNYASLGRHLLYMEYCTGGDLPDQIRKFQRLSLQVPVTFTLHVLVGLCHALAYLHHGLRWLDYRKYIKEKNHESILHGDIKPENIFLRWPGWQVRGMPDIVLADFGMAQLEVESWGVTGTPGYDSPEVAAVMKHYDVDNMRAFNRARNERIMTTKSDMYQVGLVIHLLATGRHFTTGNDPCLIELPQQYQDVTGLLAVIVWLLQSLPKDRPECTGNMKDGFLMANDVLKRQRDALLARLGAVDQSHWNICDLSEKLK